MTNFLIKNAKTIEGNKVDIKLENKIIEKISSSIDEKEGREIIDLKNNYFVSAGWIDNHVHCYEKMNLYYDTPDKIGIEKGVTTVIDAGSTGADNIKNFYKMIQSSKTNVYALLNISRTGIIDQNELENLEDIDLTAIEQTVNELPHFIKGFKARMSQSVVGENNYLPLEKIESIRDKFKHYPLMVHIGSAPPKLSEVLSRMRRGDILTHCFNGKLNGILNRENNAISSEAWEAYEKGIVFDIGHGTDSFNFDVAEAAFKKGMVSHSISTDIYHRNRDNGPVYDLATTMEKMRTIGYSWSEIINQVTQKPADHFHLEKKGYLESGMDADLTIFEIKKQEKELIDSNGNKRVVSEGIVPKAVVIGGEYYELKS